jgi:hypothetical protein
MINRKLLEVLVRFDTEEHKRFDLFLRSPYFNAGSNATQVVDLYEYITRFSADENHPSLDKSQVFEVFYPGKTFKENEKNALDTLTSDLFRQVRQFLAQRAWEHKESPMSEVLPQLHFYRKFGLEERYLQTAKNAKKQFEKLDFLSSDVFYEKFLFEEEITIFKTLNNTYEDDINIESMLQSLDFFFILSKLSHTALLKLQKRISSGVNDEMNALHKAAMQMAREGYCQDTPLAELLLIVLDLMENPDDFKLLATLGEKLKNHKKNLQFRDYQNVQTYYRVFCGLIYQKSGRQEDKEKYFHVMQEHLAEGLYYYDHKLMISSLTSLTNLGIAFRQYDWVLKILKDHPTEKLTGTRYLSEGYQLNWAEYYLALKDYNNALAHLEYKMFENPVYSILAEIILLRVYYETENELLDSRIKALEQKIRRTALAADLKKSFQLFIQKLDKMNKYRLQKGSPKLAKLAEEIKTAPGIAYRNWLLEKINL